MNRHVAIVGAGPGGLASAMLLARLGADVTVFEKQEHVGGRTSLMREGGFTFDTGPTFFLYPQVLTEVFRACGFDLRREVDLIRLDPQYRLQFEDGARIDATPDLEGMAAQIGAIAPGDAAGFGRFMEENRRKFAAFMPVFSRPFEGPMDFLAPPILRALKLLRPTRSVDQDLKRFFSRPAHPHRLLVPEQIPGHVAVPVPRPVHHPAVPRIRARRVPPARRLRRRDGDDGEARAAHGRAVPHGASRCRRS